MTFPRMACQMLTVDAVDVSGEQHFDINHEIFKTSLGMSFYFICHSSGFFNSIELFHLREQVTCNRELDFFPVNNFSYTSKKL